MSPSRDRVLIVEDDPVARRMLAMYFGEAGFDIMEAATGTECRALLRRQHVDLVLLDIGLPDADGVKLGQDIQADSAAGVIFVTCRTSEVDRIVGLEVAGDDYVTKPVHLRELLARARAVLRRREKGGKASRDKRLGFGDWTLDPVRRELTDGAGAPLRLTGGEFDLLAALAEANGRPLTRDYLGEIVSRHGAEANARTIDTLVARLRRKLHDPAKAPRAILTLPGVGYRLGLDVRRG